MSDPVSTRNKSQKVKQKQRPSSISSVLSRSNTKNSSSSTLPIQTPMDSKSAMNSASSLVIPESKPEAPVLEPAMSDPPDSTPSTPAPKESGPLAPPEPEPAASAPVQIPEPVTLPAPTPPASVPVPPPVSVPAPAPASVKAIPASPPAKEPVTPNGPAANYSPPTVSVPTEPRPVGGRRNKSDDETNGSTRGGELVTSGAGAIPNAGLQIPGKLLNDPDEKAALKIKVHLNLHAKVRLDLDAQIYGDVVIGLL